jgi:tetratricopeptide (TPR) repeat protein
MAFRFFRRVKIAPGISVNLSKSGASLSVGPRGAKVTVGPRGTRRTVGIPGTGMYWYETSGSGRSSRSGSGSSGRSRRPVPQPRVRPEDQLDLGFFKRLFTPAGEEAFVDGMREMVGGDAHAALERLAGSVHIADGAFVAGLLALEQDRLNDAEQYLIEASRRSAELGEMLRKYGLAARAMLSITDEITTSIEVDSRGVLLALAEVYQEQDRWDRAMEQLRAALRRDPSDVGIRLSLAEILVEDVGDPEALKEVVALTEGIDNTSPLHAALLLYKGKALHRLGLHTAARDALTAASRRKKDRPAELLREARYERALVYHKLGRKKRCREELEKIYAEDPDFEDVAQRLGL